MTLTLAIVSVTINMGFCMLVILLATRFMIKSMVVIRFTTTFTENNIVQSQVRHRTFVRALCSPFLVIMIVTMIVLMAGRHVESCLAFKNF